MADIEIADVADPGVLVGVEGITAEQFAAKTAALRGFEVESEDDVPGSVVMRADYDNSYRALAAENETLAALTNANRSIANAMVALVNGARIFARQHSLEPNQLEISERAATDVTLVFRIEAAS